jgi:hypothetical protein
MTMRLFLLSVATLSAVWPGLAQEPASQGQLYRGPLVRERTATLVLPDRPLPVEFDDARLDLGSPAPWAALSDARLSVGVRSNTLRPITVRGITLRVAVGPAEHGMFTFRMRGIASIYAPEELLRLPADGLFRPLRFATVANEPLPQLLLMNPRTRIVFTLERVDGINGPVVFENPDATELLWEALGRPSFSQ